MNVGGGLFNFEIFKYRPYTVFVIANFFAFLGLYTSSYSFKFPMQPPSDTVDTVLTFLDLSAIAIGVSPNFSFYLVAISNAASTLGRFAAGLGTDRFGKSK